MKTAQELGLTQDELDAQMEIVHEIMAEILADEA